MSILDLRIPPPVVAVLVGLAMWFAAPVGAAPHLGPATRYVIASAIGVAGLAFIVSGLTGFRKAQTTTNPQKPERASVLVTGGIYRYTRNPMYLGLCFLLTAWAVYLSGVLPFLGPVIFVLYIGRFQIRPEERVLNQIFGQQYAEYTARVRRWL